MGLTNRSRQQSAKREQAKQQLNQLETKASNSTKPDKKQIMKKISVLQQQAEDISDEAAYASLTAQIRHLSSQL